MIIVIELTTTEFTITTITDFMTDDDVLMVVKYDKLWIMQCSKSIKLLIKNQIIV